MWYNGPSVYPDYLNDPAIAVCPSDPRIPVNNPGSNDLSYNFVDPVLADDLSEQIQEYGRRTNLPAGNADYADRICLDYYTSASPSYRYFPWAVTTISQWGDAATLAHWYRLGDGAVAENLNVQAVADADKEGCVEAPVIDQKEVGFVELDNQLQSGSGYVFDSATVPRYDDDGVSLLREQWPRLKEGIERFFITDINNPAGSAEAQSTLIVMADSYTLQGSGVGQAFADSGIGNFNHVPGGANILFMDGHVEFVRFGSNPVWIPPRGPNVPRIYGTWHVWSLLGGSG
jgi:prepilin-type processing-associated H-X9-DG protein